MIAPLTGEVAPLEPWLDRQALAEYLGCSVRSVELRMAEGMPAWKIMGRVKFRVSEVEPWLAEYGHMARLDGPVGEWRRFSQRGGDRDHGPAP